jgi:hypothetical protein
VSSFRAHGRTLLNVIFSNIVGRSRSWDIVDIAKICLSITPFPILQPAFAVFATIVSAIEQVQTGKRQLEVLAQSVAQLLHTLNTEYSTNRLLEANTSTALDGLLRFVIFIYVCANPCIIRPHSSHSLFHEISAFILKEASAGFLKQLFTKDQRIARIEEYHRHIGSSVASFQASYNDSL